MKRDTVKEDLLDSECRTFCMYLSGRMPERYILKKYREGHKIEQLRDEKCSAFDRVLLGLARRRVFFTRLVDCYTRRFYQTALVRKKLILLLSMLECTAPYFTSFETVSSSSRFLIIISFFKETILFSIFFLLSVLIFAPIQLMYASKR
jgi:hypothetical protein